MVVAMDNFRKKFLFEADSWLTAELKKLVLRRQTQWLESGAHGTMPSQHRVLIDTVRAGIVALTGNPEPKPQGRTQAEQLADIKATAAREREEAYAKARAEDEVHRVKLAASELWDKEHPGEWPPKELGLP
jgi:hypothetical protein